MVKYCKSIARVITKKMLWGKIEIGILYLLYNIWVLGGVEGYSLFVMVPFGTARSGGCHRRFAKRNAATETKAFGHGSCMPRVVGTANTEPKDI